jgi:hypothetical protein
MAEQGMFSATPAPNDLKSSNSRETGAKAMRARVRRFVIVVCSAAICIALGLTLFKGRHEARILDTSAWTEAEEVAKSTDSLATSLSLYKWNSSLLALGGDSGTFAVRVLDAKDWRTLSKIDPGWIPMDADPKANRFVRSRATLLSDSLDARFTIGSLSPDGQFTTRATAPLHLDRAKLFSTTIATLRMSESKKPVEIGFDAGTMEGEEIRIPYRIAATPIEGKTIRADLAVSANGVFASSDGGRTWRVEAISTLYSNRPVACRTAAFYYYFAAANPGPPLDLWYSRRPVYGGAWGSGVKLNKKVASNLSAPNFRAIGEKDILHLCWLDARHEDAPLSLNRPRAGNYEVAYSHRRDSDSGWNNDAVLSKGLRYAYAPSMSVEGSNVVIAWAGAPSGTNRNEWNPTDIYYVTSTNEGNSWSKIMQVTNRFKEGITSGRPQVALHGGVIHLFYVQGKLNYKVSGGMALLNQPPWSVVYQRRALPI